MKKLGKILALVLAASLVLSLVACGGSDSGDKTLKIFGNIGNPDGLSVIDEDMINKFKEKTGVTVEIETVASSGYLEKLQLMLASGEYPDAALFPSTTTQAYVDSVDSGIVVELNQYLTEENAPNLMA
ncbi:MAG: extracellular solute-binding protein, partial [Clostridia bacterium]|nr:extracellular solute-binding protein [Clostridia bacterium]